MPAVAHSHNNRSHLEQNDLVGQHRSPNSSYCSFTISELSLTRRFQRSKKDEKLENFLTELQRLTIVHEREADLYTFTSSKDKTGQKGDNHKSNDSDQKTDNKPSKKSSGTSATSNTAAHKDNPSKSEKTAASEEEAS